MEWFTKKLADQSDRYSPDATSEIRFLPSFAQGEILHATANARKSSTAAMLIGIAQFFYVLDGEGELWRATGDLYDVVPLRPGRCVSIPPGIEYQYRADRVPLRFLVTTVPRWGRDNLVKAKRYYWNEDGKAISTSSRQPGPWMTAGNVTCASPPASKVDKSRISDPSGAIDISPGGPLS